MGMSEKTPSEKYARVIFKSAPLHWILKNQKNATRWNKKNNNVNFSLFHTY